MQDLKEPPTKITKAEVENDLREYARMVRDMQRITAELQEIQGGSMTARWTDMPNARGGISNPTERAVIKRDRKWRRLEQLEQRTKRIEKAADGITDIKQSILLDLIMDGKNSAEICAYMRLSRSYINEIKWQLVENLVAEIRKQEGERNE